MSRLKIFKQLLSFFLQRKRLWMFPLILILGLLGLLIVFTQGSALAPFIYTLF